jgi:hypothetical protein
MAGTQYHMRLYTSNGVLQWEKYFNGESEIIHDAFIHTKHFFKSYSDLILCAEKGPFSESAKGFRSSATDNDRFGASTFEEAIKKAWYGDREILKAVRESRDQIVRQLNDTTYVQDWQYSESGAGVDVAKFVTGQPDCMFDILPTEKKSITIAINFAYCWNYSHAQVIAAGAAVFIIAEWFHRNRYNVRIVGDEVCGRNGRYYWLSFPIKEYHQPFDTGRIAFILAHPGFLRKVIFAVNDSTGDDVRDYFGFHSGGGYGSVSTKVLTDAQIKLNMQTLCDNAKTIQKSVDFIKGIIAKKYD